ncbi:hypothetical protein DM01DRAFT_253043 [Hesseltinella vesiculosa]|uniref:Protein YTP1-like C-terminal domain-containing protein n=1 Tax=Hesseltinella vesiculosa TaxID=101127 RepID=A0A1X2G7X2_9FUNG|nr:hypothetical protein DM01DRAFT_253043 [Hesseltinella vesiculosa]
MPAFNATGDEPMSYALFPDNKGYFYGHVAFMVLGFWILLPMGIMFGIARSPFHVPTQILAFLVSTLGFFFGKMYGHSTPHLYAGNSHHTMGWIIYLFFQAQMSIGVVRKIANAVARSQQAYQSLHEEETVRLVRSSYPTSPQGDSHSEGSMETLHHTFDDHPKTEEDDDQAIEQVDSEDDELLQDPITMEKEEPPLWMRPILFVLPYIPGFIKASFVTAAYNPFTKTVCRIVHSLLGRVFIILVFAQTLSGLVVYHGVCRSWDIFPCVAHLIKGGIFFFYGILTFGRYLGAFAEKGWAWNRVDGGAKFSFETIECGLIFTYGITNTWMEHFGKDDAWTHKDFEHASLAFMWWWCGLIGLLVESRALRRLLERHVLKTPLDATETKQSYSFNPFPALTVMLTGISMGNHHQETQYSTNVHYMWGLLLALAAVSRLATYILIYNSPPSGLQPGRPPTELIGAFCLIAGSILFMASNTGTMTWMRRLEIDTMFMMNVTIALTSLTLCYVAFMMILKAWAMKREDRKKAAKQSYPDRFVGQA